MGKLTFFSNYLNNISQTPNQQWRSEQQAFVSSEYQNSTVIRKDVFEEGYPFDFKFVNNPECWVGTVLDVTTGIVKDSDDYRSLYFMDLNHESGRGRYFKWADNYWIVYETTTHELETISTCNIRRCNNWLKWLNDKGEVIQYPCVIEGELTSANAQVSKTITQANSHINVIVQGNKDTLSLIKNSRIMFNHSVYKFSAINNYMQVDYVDDNTPLLFMDFYLDMEIDEDNVEENLADDLRRDFIVECNITQLHGQVNTEGNIVSTVYHKNNVVPNVRMEYFSSDDTIVNVDNNGYYKMRKNGEATISVRILGNEISTVEIPVTVEDVTTIEHNIIVSPIITSIRQGLSSVLTAKIVDNLNNEITDTITLTASGTDNRDNYSLVDNNDNTWILTNKLKSKLPLTLTFKNDTYNVEYVMNIQLKAMY
jgi:hypothetical protein